MPTKGLINLDTKIHDYVENSILPAIYPFENPIQNALSFEITKAQRALKTFLLSAKYRAFIETLKDENFNVSSILVTSQSSLDDFFNQCISEEVLYLMQVENNDDPGPVFLAYGYRPKNKELIISCFIDLLFENAEATIFKSNETLCDSLLADPQLQLKESGHLTNYFCTHAIKLTPQTLDHLQADINDYNKKWGEFLPVTLKKSPRKNNLREATLKMTEIKFNQRQPMRTDWSITKKISLDLSSQADHSVIPNKTPSVPRTPTQKASSWLNTSCCLFGVVAVTGLSLMAAYNQTMQSDHDTRQITP